MNIKFLKFGLFVLLFAMAIFTTACGNSTTESDNTETTEETEGHEHSEEGVTSDKSGKEYTSAYVCPMHCEGSGSDVEGKCPVCGMDYVALADLEKDEHTHE